jgi:hypothetical protein
VQNCVASDRKGEAVVSGVVLLVGQLSRWQAWLESGVALLLAGVLFLLTWQQSRMYTNAETLYRTTIARNPNCWMAYNESCSYWNRPKSSSALIAARRTCRANRGRPLSGATKIVCPPLAGLSGYINPSFLCKKNRKSIVLVCFS